MSSSGHDDEPSPERLVKGEVGVGVGTSTHGRRIKKKRVRNFTEDDRAAHRIFEKSRREAFKEALTHLASLLPALADTEPQRLSKHVVVDESITFIKAQQEQINTIAEHLEDVKTERDELLAEINHWRSSAGMEPRSVSTVSKSTSPHGHPSTTSETILGTTPTILQSADVAVPVLVEAAPSFISNPLHESNSTSLSSVMDTGMAWGSYASQIHSFGSHPSHVQGGNGLTGSNNNHNNNSNIRSPDSTQMTTSYQTSQSPNISQFGIDREAVFMSYESTPSFNSGGFQTDTFMQNTPLQDYIAP